MNHYYLQRFKDVRILFGAHSHVYTYIYIYIRIVVYLIIFDATRVIMIMVIMMLMLIIRVPFVQCANPPHVGPTCGAYPRRPIPRKALIRFVSSIIFPQIRPLESLSLGAISNCTLNRHLHLLSQHLERSPLVWKSKPRIS